MKLWGKLATFVLVTILLALALAPAARYGQLHEARAGFERVAAAYAEEVTRTGGVTPQTQARFDAALRRLHDAERRWERSSWLTP